MQRALIADSGGHPFGTANPFRIAAEIRQLIGQVDEAKSTQAGGLMITTKNAEQADALLQLNTFLERRVDVSRPDSLNSGGRRICNLPERSARRRAAG